MAIPETWNTGLTVEQLSEAFSRALGDLTDDEISALLDKKADKVSGKGLSTNDYTDPEKNKLAGLENYDDTALQESVSSLNSVVFSRGTALGSGDDLNDYQTSGAYYAVSAAVSGTILNKPAAVGSVAFRLTVELTTAEGRVLQTLHANSDDGAFYQRKLIPTGWTGWYKFSGEPAAG